MPCAMRRMGSFSPVLEWTQVMPTARVFGLTARRMRSTIASSEMESMLSNSAILRYVAPLFSVARRMASCWE